MAKANNSALDNYADIFRDPYFNLPDSGVITGGVTNHTQPSVDPSYWADNNSITGGGDNIINIPEGGKVCIGDDFVMTGKEFKVCMKMLQKMAMKEMPEEFI